MPYLQVPFPATPPALSHTYMYNFSPSAPCVGRAHKALDGDKIATFPTIYAAVEFCETQLIWAVTQAKTTVKQGNGNATSQGRGIRGDGERGPWSFGLFNQMDSCRSIPVSSVKDVLLQVLEVSGIDAPFTVDCIARYCVEEKYDPGSVIFTPGDTADRFFIIAEGKVSMVEFWGRPRTYVGIQ
ncbi:unnamed protein product [Choristocarpus tenellus]